MKLIRKKFLKENGLFGWEIYYYFLFLNFLIQNLDFCITYLLIFFYIFYLISNIIFSHYFIPLNLI